MRWMCVRAREFGVCACARVFYFSLNVSHFLTIKSPFLSLYLSHVHAYLYTCIALSLHPLYLPFYLSPSLSLSSCSKFICLVAVNLVGLRDQVMEASPLVFPSPSAISPWNGILIKHTISLPRSQYRSTYP